MDAYHIDVTEAGKTGYVTVDTLQPVVFDVDDTKESQVFWRATISSSGNVTEEIHEAPDKLFKGKLLRVVRIGTATIKSGGDVTLPYFYITGGAVSAPTGSITVGDIGQKSRYEGQIDDPTLTASGDITVKENMKSGTLISDSGTIFVARIDGGVGTVSLQAPIVVVANNRTSNWATVKQIEAEFLVLPESDDGKTPLNGPPAELFPPENIIYVTDRQLWNARSDKGKALKEVIDGEIAKRKNNANFSYLDMDFSAFDPSASNAPRLPRNAIKDLS